MSNPPDILEKDGRWKWMRLVHGMEFETVEYYKEQSRTNGWKMIPRLNQDAFDVYIWISSKATQVLEGE